MELSEVRLVHGDKGILVGQPLVKGARSRRKSSTRAGLDRSWSSRSNGARTTGARRVIVGLYKIAHHWNRNSVRNFMATNKGGGSSRNGRDSNPQYLGVKAAVKP